MRHYDCSICLGNTGWTAPTFTGRVELLRDGRPSQVYGVYFKAGGAYAWRCAFGGQNACRPFHSAKSEDAAIRAIKRHIATVHSLAHL